MCVCVCVGGGGGQYMFISGHSIIDIGIGTHQINRTFLCSSEVLHFFLLILGQYIFISDQCNIYRD